MANGYLILKCKHCQLCLDAIEYFIFHVLICNHCGWSYCQDTQEWFDENGNKVEGIKE
jgi:hypothetical protein